MLIARQPGASMHAGGVRRAAASRAPALPLLRRPRAAPRRAAAGPQQLGPQQQQQPAPEDAPLRDLGPEAALALAWRASQGRSLLAAQAFCEAVLHEYARGATCDDLEIALQLRALQAAPGAPAALAPQELDLMVTWLLTIMLTASELGLPREQRQLSGSGAGGGGGAEEDADAAGADLDPNGVTRRHGAQSLGLLNFVKATLSRYDKERATLGRVAALQAAARASQEGFSGAAEAMQAVTRLALITLEAAAAGGAPLNRPLQQPVTISAPTGYAAALLGGGEGEAGGSGGASSSSSAQPGSGGGEASATGQEASSGGGTAALPSARGFAVHLLVAFIGAALGSPYCRQQFLAAAADAYSAGLPAAAILDQLVDDEFVQAGGVVPVAGDGPRAPVDITRQLFGRWLSTAYFTFAQLGAAFPAATTAGPGWAWAGGGGGDEVEANALATFVSQALAGQDVAARERAAEGAAADVTVEADALAARIRSNPEAAAQLAEASARSAEELQTRGTLRGRPAPAMVKVADPQLEATSSALLVMRQLAGLVEGAAALVAAAAARQGGRGGGGAGEGQSGGAGGPT